MYCTSWDGIRNTQTGSSYNLELIMLGSLPNCKLDKGALSYLSFIPLHPLINVSFVPALCQALSELEM